MEKLIKAIGQYLNDIGKLEFLIDNENKRIVDFDFDEIDRTLYDGLELITNHLQLIYLNGNDLILYRVKAELLKIESTLLKSNFGINIRVVELNFDCSIEPEIHETLNKIKLKYVKELIELIDSFLPYQQTETKIEQRTPTFTNNFDNIEPTEIYKHFKAGLVGKGYLTEQELNEYLKAAFESKTIPKTLFKIKNAPNKAAIEAVFYTYYKNVAGKIYGRQILYAALLGDYFEGYKTTTVSSNFSKSVY